jgi:hypothetical protein
VTTIYLATMPGVMAEDIQAAGETAEQALERLRGAFERVARHHAHIGEPLEHDTWDTAADYFGAHVLEIPPVGTWYGGPTDRLLGASDPSPVKLDSAATAALERVRERLVDDSDAYADVDLLHMLYTAITGEEIAHPFDSDE